MQRKRKENQPFLISQIVKASLKKLSSKFLTRRFIQLGDSSTISRADSTPDSSTAGEIL